MLKELENNESMNFAHPTVSADGDHIFFDLEKYGMSILDVEKNMSMCYIFFKNEECLSLLRRRRFDSFRCSYSDLANLDIKLDYRIDNGILHLLKAMEAYKFYIEGAYEKALKEMDCCIDFGIRQSTFTYSYLIAIQEQWLNKIKLLSKMSLIDKTSKILFINGSKIYDLLSFLKRITSKGLYFTNRA
ncbi:MAG: hypothetical protein QM610_06805 [Chitinophagaceae bacterium]